MDNKGSIWRKWDLHIHTPASGFATDNDYATLIENIKNSEADVVGINDYSTLEGYSKILDLGGVPDKEIYPVVEFRMINKINHKNSTATSGGVSINFHVIFDNSIPVQSILTEINALECFYEGGNETKLGHVTSVDDRKKVSLDFFKTEKALRDSKILKDRYLIWVPYDEYGGVDPIDPINDGFFKLGIIKKADVLGSANKKQIDFFLSKQCVESIGKTVPCIKGSDSHEIDYPFGKLKDKNSQPIEKYCWIKADKSFKGLKHLIIEPESRVFIGKTPFIIERVNNNRTKYLKSISVKAVEGYDGKYGQWFDDIEIPLNYELVAIIGNKGSGKSALADIISLCSNFSGNHDDFSFLNSKKFNASGGKIAKNFEATITWESGVSNNKNLADNLDNGAVELVKYLPQGYFERLTNEISSVEDFKKEIENVVYTHLDDDDRIGVTSFDELINKRKELIHHEINILKERLTLVNQSIFEKEKKLNTNYKLGLEAQIRQKKEELIALVEPIEVKNPSEDPTIAEKNKEINSRISAIQTTILDLEKIIEEKTNLKRELLAEINEIKDLKQRFKSKEEELNFFKTTYLKDLSKFSISFDDTLKYEFNYTQIDNSLSLKEKKLKEIRILLGDETSDNVDFIPLSKQLSGQQENLYNIQKNLDEAERKYQSYLTDKKTWEEGKKIIIGDFNIPNSLSFYEQELEFVNKSLIPEIENERNSRFEIVQSIYSKMESILEIYKTVKKKIDLIIADNAELLDQYKINIDASFNLKHNFQTKFLNFVSLNKTGTFYGRDNAEMQLNKLIEGVNWDCYQDVKELLEKVIRSFFNDNRNDNNSQTFIETQVDEVVNLYDYLFSLEFLDYNYELRQGSKKLEQLSPGEKGALLLIFYLLLDNSDIPLIIDQPEDNLDNNSVANVLVPFIKKAKTKRQIILVTHNPNLAVVADAEQVIYVDLDKENKNEFSFKSGSIENPVINECIVKVLEGAMPAFNKRKQKYYDQ